MDIQNIVTMLSSIFSYLYAIILTVIFIVKTIKSKKKQTLVITNTEPSVSDDILNLLLQLPEVISNTEEKFKNMFGNIKTGAFKLDSALSIMRDLCDNNGTKFDRDFWTNAINNIVSVTKSGNQVHNVDEDKKITFSEN